MRRGEAIGDFVITRCKKAVGTVGASASSKIRVAGVGYQMVVDVQERLPTDGFRKPVGIQTIWIKLILIFAKRLKVCDSLPSYEVAV
jgi:hypothetical protein